MLKFAYGGPESICQSIYIDAIVKSGSLATTHPTLQNQRTPIKNSDVNRGEDVQDFALIDKVASSSSMELKLGQPYQKNHSPGNPVLAVIGPQFDNTIVNSHKVFSQEQIIHNVISCKAEEESRHYLPCAVGLSNFTIRREQDHLNHTNCAINNTLDAAKLEQLKGNTAKTSAVSLFKHCTLSEGSSQYRATDNLHNVSKHVIPKTQHCESHAVRCDLINAPGNARNHFNKRDMIPELSISKLADKGKGVGCLGGNSYVQTASGSKLQKWMKNTKSSTGVANGNNISVFLPMHDGSNYSHCSSNMPPDASDAGNFLNCLETVPFSGSSGRKDHAGL